MDQTDCLQRLLSPLALRDTEALLGEARAIRRLGLMSLEPQADAGSPSAASGLPESTPSGPRGAGGGLGEDPFVAMDAVAHLSDWLSGEPVSGAGEETEDAPRPTEELQRRLTAVELERNVRRRESEQLRRNFSEAQAAHRAEVAGLRAELAARDVRIAELQRRLAGQAHCEERVRTLEQELAALRRRPPPAPPALQELTDVSREQEVV